VSHQPEISKAARAELRAQLIPDVAIDAAECMLGHVLDAAETMAREYDRDAGDDPNLAGFTVARRAKNLAARDLRHHELPGVRVLPAAGFTWNINADGTRLHTYSAPGGLDGFQLIGGDRKAGVVERSMEQLSLFRETGARKQPGDLVLAYVRDLRGVRHAVLGVMKSGTEFEWQVSIYDADGAATETAGDGAVEAKPSFREQPEKLADISLRRAQEKRENL
jgi:hypothetical protein